MVRADSPTVPGLRFRLARCAPLTWHGRATRPSDVTARAQGVVRESASRGIDTGRDAAATSKRKTIIMMRMINSSSRQTHTPALIRAVKSKVACVDTGH